MAHEYMPRPGEYEGTDSEATGIPQHRDYDTEYRDEFNRSIEPGLDLSNPELSGRFDTRLADLAQQTGSKGVPKTSNLTVRDVYVCGSEGVISGFFQTSPEGADAQILKAALNNQVPEVPLMSSSAPPDIAVRLYNGNVGEIPLHPHWLGKGRKLTAGRASEHEVRAFGGRIPELQRAADHFNVDRAITQLDMSDPDLQRRLNLPVAEFASGITVKGWPREAFSNTSLTLRDIIALGSECILMRGMGPKRSAALTEAIQRHIPEIPMTLSGASSTGCQSLYDQVDDIPVGFDDGSGEKITVGMVKTKPEAYQIFSTTRRAADLAKDGVSFGRSAGGTTEPSSHFESPLGPNFHGDAVVDAIRRVIDTL